MPRTRTARVAAVCGLLLAGVACSLGAARLAAAQRGDGQRGSADQRTVAMATELLAQYHVKQQPVDDATSRKLFERIFKALDPAKLYFYRDDLEAFRQYETQLDDRAKRGDLSFIDAVYRRLLARMEQRVAHAQTLIDRDFDFTRDESIVADADDLEWAKTPAEMNDRWRKRIKYDVLQLKLEDTPIEQIRERLHKRYSNLLATEKQVEPDDKMETFLTALAETFDPHSSFMSEKTMDDFRISMNLRLEGIGAALQNEEGYVTVKQIVPGGAAEEDGRLHIDDKIIGVSQEGEGEFTDVVEMRIGNVVRLIRGESGTKVKLQVKPADEGPVKTIELTRRQIELEDSAVRGEVIDLGPRVGVQGVKVGVINIPSFYRDFGAASAGREDFRSTSRDVRVVLDDFEKRGGVDAVIVDLRFNGGGALAEAIEVTGLFIDEGPVVQIKNTNGEVEVDEDEVPGAAYTGPLVVLTNRLAASASEIFAGAIKDYDRGLVVGDTTTHGKGTVQNVMSIPPGRFQFLAQPNGQLKLTIAQFYRISGDSTQNLGVRSDVVLPSLLDHMELGESYLENALAFDRIAPAPHLSLRTINPQMVGQLQAGSERRVKQSGDFAELGTRIAEYEAEKEKGVVSLNEAARRAEREAAEARSKNEEEEEEVMPPRGQGPIFREHFYNDEVLRVTADYLALRNAATTAAR